MPIFSFTTLNKNKMQVVFIINKQDNHKVMVQSITALLSFTSIYCVYDSIFAIYLQFHSMCNTNVWQFFTKPSFELHYIRKSIYSNLTKSIASRFFIEQLIYYIHHDSEARFIQKQNEKNLQLEYFSYFFLYINKTKPKLWSNFIRYIPCMQELK